MLADQLAILYDRELNRLLNEISSYKEEGNIWRTSEGITNCGGNLCLHIIGNLNYFIGTGLGKSGYIRNREAEFADKNIPMIELMEAIIDLRAILKTVFSSLKEKDLKANYPMPIPEKDGMTTEFFLVHLYGHLTYHLGQINYHRRLLEAKSTEG